MTRVTILPLPRASGENSYLALWQAYVASRNQWRVRRYGGYRVKSVNITGFWRPRLAGQVSN